MFAPITDCFMVFVLIQYHSFEEFISIMRQVSLTLAVGEAVSATSVAVVASCQDLMTALCVY